MKKQLNPTMKAHFIRGVSYVLLLMGICLLSFAATPRKTFRVPALTSATASKQLGIRGMALPAAPLAPQVILYDQYDNSSTNATAAENFDDFTTFSNDLADDFVVPAGQIWTVQSIDADGLYFSGAGPATSFNVFFYTDSATLPGAAVYSATNQPFTQVGTTFTVNLSVPAVLPAGTYWAEVQANINFTNNGQWAWTDRTVQAGNGAAFQNPGGGFGVCPTWNRKTTCVPTAGGPDQVFRLNGTSAPAGGCTVCHKNTTTLTLPCSSLEYRRHLDHGDPPNACNNCFGICPDGLSSGRK